MAFKDNLNKLRDKDGLTQEALASELNLSRSAIAKLESGKGIPSTKNLNALSVCFKVSLDTLLKGDVSVYENMLDCVTTTEEVGMRPIPPGIKAGLETFASAINVVIKEVYCENE